MAEIQFFDVARLPSTAVVDTYFDVKRKEAPKQDTNFFDVQRIIPMSTPDYSQLNITIGAGMLSDSFQMSVPLGTAKLDDVIAGSLNGWSYDFSISEITKRNGIAEYRGIYNNNMLQYTYYDYTVDFTRRKLPDRIGVSAYSIINDIARQMGLTLIYNAMDWQYPLPKVKEEEAYSDYKRGWYSISGTYQSVISQLFGWLSMLPHINFSATIRDGKLIITQRGHEQGTPYALQTVEFPPSTHYRKVHTEWAGSGNPNEANYQPDSETREPFTGIITFGDCVIEYQDGLLTTETRGTSTTTYTYELIDDEPYLKVKETIDTDAESCSKTEYYYTQFGAETYLQREETWTDGTVTNDTPDYSLAEHTVQTHVPVGNGWYGTTVYDSDGEVSSTSLSQGMPGNSVTRYMVDVTQDAFTDRKADREIVEALLRFLNPPCISTSYPVTDNETVEDLIDATDWLNNRTEETVTLTTVDTHIIDTTQTVGYNGNTYYVESNNITHGVNGLRQSLTLKRWY